MSHVWDHVTSPPPIPLSHTHRHTRIHTSRACAATQPSQAMQCTSHLPSKGISPQILPLNYWRGPSRLDSDYPSINTPCLSSYNIKCLWRSIQPIRGATAARNAECVVLLCLHWRCSACVIGVFMLWTGVIADWLRCFRVFLLPAMCHR